MTAENMTLRHVVADLEALRVHLKQERLFLVGHSWGGMLAMAYAAAHPDRIDRMILIGPGGPTLEFAEWFNDNIHMRLRSEDVEAERYWTEAPKRGVDPDKAALEQVRAITPGYFFERAKGLAFASQLPDGTLTLQVNALLFGDMSRGYDSRPGLRQLDRPGPDRSGTSGPGWRQDRRRHSRRHKIVRADVPESVRTLPVARAAGCVSPHPGGILPIEVGFADLETYMLTKTHRSLAVFAATVMVLGITMSPSAPTSAQQASTLKAPAFELDPKWPTIPNNWVLGEVSSIAVDSRDHIWVLHRPRSIPAEKRANAAPPVLEFDTSGKLLRSWGGDGARIRLARARARHLRRCEGIRLDQRQRRLARSRRRAAAPTT